MTTRPGVYCHGMPGGPEELTWATSGAGAWTALDLLNVHSDRPLQDLCQSFDGETSEPLDVCGFSLGAVAALHLAAQVPDKVRSLTLISPAAPLSLGAFLPDMAGAQVFRVARSDRRLAALLKAQAMAVRISPALVSKAMFSTASPDERGLLSDKSFAAMTKAGLRRALITHRPAYAAWLSFYVQDWASILGQVTCPVHIWHGAEDAWTPPDMARALERALPRAQCRIIPGLGHYGTLREMMRKKKGRAKSSAKSNREVEGRLAHPSTD